MNRTVKVLFIFLLYLSSCAYHLGLQFPSDEHTVGTVVASHQIAVGIGMAVLKSGGNAVDAAVATGLTLGVVDQFNSGIGGGGFILIRLSDGTVYTIDGRETAPAEATRDMYIQNEEFTPQISQLGPLAVGVPGILTAYEKALELAGTKLISELITPSSEVAKQGFDVDAYYLSRYRDVIELLKENPESRRIYFRKDGSPLQEGDILIQPDLAETYEKIKRGGINYFYRGEFSKQLAKFMAENGGLITENDMAGYSVRLRNPVIGRFRDYEIIGMAPPSSGGILILEILNMLESSGVLEGKNNWDEETVYWTTLFMRKAFEDRALHLGDPDFYSVPVDHLISKSYADSSVQAIMSENSEISEKVRSNVEIDGHTTSFSVVDRWGNVVVVNQTLNLTFGSKITLPGTGVILNNEMDDFSAQPGAPNVFGLTGSRANAIAPGKRPLSSMSPTIVVKNGKPILLLGGAGGPTIISGVLETIIGVTAFDLSLEKAMAAPRFHHQFRPDVVIMEKTMPEEIQNFVKERGLPVVLKDHIARIHAIAWEPDSRSYIAVSEPRY